MDKSSSSKRAFFTSVSEETRSQIFIWSQSLPSFPGRRKSFLNKKTLWGLENGNGEDLSPVIFDPCLGTIMFLFHIPTTHFIRDVWPPISHRRTSSPPFPSIGFFHPTKAAKLPPCARSQLARQAERGQSVTWWSASASLRSRRSSGWTRRCTGRASTKAPD